MCFGNGCDSLFGCNYCNDVNLFNSPLDMFG
jgi:hypothetical protein